ncbi:DUF397 domain-containing protein [Streptomyces bobili]|uniref:DUF397 domain-containing protein n=1 Tax=Streptomyces bobili TaxID=67280 RepID=UPI0033DA6A37
MRGVRFCVSPARRVFSSVGGDGVVLQQRPDSSSGWRVRLRAERVGEGGDEDSPRPDSPSFATGSGSPTVRTVCGRSGPSFTQGDSCVEVTVTEQTIFVRDSKDVTRPHFVVGSEGWSRFVGFAGRS